MTGTAGNAVTLAASSSPASNCTVSGATLSGGAALTAGHVVLVEPQFHPVELQAIWGISETTQAAGTITLYLCDGSKITKVDAITYGAGATLSGTQELSRIAFPNISASSPLLVPALSGLYAYGGTTQTVDLYAGPGGSY